MRHVNLHYFRLFNHVLYRFRRSRLYDLFKLVFSPRLFRNKARERQAAALKVSLFRFVFLLQKMLTRIFVIRAHDLLVFRIGHWSSPSIIYANL
jgi:hypothetical protein